MRASPEGQGSDVGGSPVAEDFVLPVHVGIEVRILAGAEGFQLVGRVAGGASVVGQRLVHGQGVGVGVGHFGHVRLVVESVVVGEADLAALVLAPLGDDVHHAVDAPVAIESHGCGIAQDADRLHFFGRDVVEGTIGVVTLQTVHHEQDAVVAVERLASSDVHGGDLFPDVAGGLHGVEAGHVAIEGVAHVEGGAVVDLVGIDRGHRAGALGVGLLQSEAIVHLLAGEVHHDGHFLACDGFHQLDIVSSGAHLQEVTFHRIDLKLPLPVGRGPQERVVFHRNQCAFHGVAQAVHHLADHIDFRLRQTLEGGASQHSCDCYKFICSSHVVFLYILGLLYR